MLRFRRFRSRLLVLIVGLVAIVQGAAFLVVTQVHRRNAESTIADNLVSGARRFDRLVLDRLDDYSARAELMTGDYALRQVLLNASDTATVRSALQSYIGRFGSSLMVLMSADQQPLAGSYDKMTPADWSTFTQLARQADSDSSSNPHATGYAIIGEQLYAILVVPVFAPRPEIVAWLGVAMRIDGSFAQRMKDYSRLEITFLGASNKKGVLASTLRHPPQEAQISAGQIESTLIDGELYLGTGKSVPLVTGGHVLLLLQRSLEAELAPVRWIERLLLYGGALSLVAASIMALVLARAVSRPVQKLAAHTLRIARGDYASRITLGHADEFGELARSFNAMSEGLAERDRVRDLLDKNVSPEIAARLLRDQGALLGEEREVTLLFCDIRAFTSLSEAMQPRAVLALLNRYLDRMSAVIDRHGGIIDKYMGDEIMALFGAPVSLPDSASQALDTAVELRATLATLNEELQRESLPTLHFGIGINTAHIIAGNIGSSRRMNYSVTGDGVNIASRLQTLTRNPDFAADIILSAATLEAAGRPFRTRDLGLIDIKGRSEPVRAYALEGNVN